MTDPEIRSFGDVIVAVWPGSKIVMEFSRVSEHRDSLSAELSVTNELGPIHWSRLNLAATNGRRDVVRALEEAHPLDTWKPMLDRACQLVARHLRTGDPAVAMVLRPPGDAPRWLVNDWMPLGEITVLYGSGGSAKSLLTLALALAGILGHTLGGPWQVGSLKRVLYLDWEANRQTHEARAWGLAHRIETPPAGALLYRRLRRPLIDVIGEVRTEAERHKVDFVAMDSLGAACGPEPETAGAALGCLQALGSLPGTKMVIAHVSKVSAEQARSKPFGSVYVENTARSTIEIRRQDSDEDRETSVTLRHDKHNDGPQARPVALTFTFDPDGSIAMSRAQPDAAATSLASQILGALSETDSSVSQLAERLEANPKSVKSALQRLENRLKVRKLESVSGGRSKESLWARIDANRLGE
jgi:energy-coupling factor transporter ATP-binding protein EcfA2